MPSAGRPYAETRMAEFLQKRVLELRPRKTQGKIAEEAGFANVNMLAILKSGASKVPLDRVPELAKALECDSRLLFKLALEQSTNSMTASAVEEIFGTIVTRNEAAWIQALREATNHSDPRLTGRLKASFRAIFGK